jgi:hypothetical protein
MERRNRTATVNLTTPHGLAPRFGFAFSSTDPSFSISFARFRIYNNKDELLFEISSGGAEIVIDGLVIDVSFPVDAPGYAAIKQKRKYLYALDVNQDDTVRIQGAYESLRQAGPVSEESYTRTINLESISVEAPLSTGRVGPQGPVGPPEITKVVVDFTATDLLAGPLALFEAAENKFVLSVEIHIHEPFIGSSLLVGTDVEHDMLVALHTTYTGRATRYVCASSQTCDRLKLFMQQISPSAQGRGTIMATYF